jgi:hypothetical protein
MAILPIHIEVTETWLDITSSVQLLELIAEETVEIFHNGQGLIEVIIDTLGIITIDSTYNKKGRVINGSEFLQFTYTDTTKFWVRRIKSALISTSQIQLRKPIENINIGGIEPDSLVKSIPVTTTFHHLGHEGMVFIHATRHSSIADGANFDMLIRIPAGNANRQVHMRFNYIGKANTGVLDIDISLYKDAIVSADGTPESISTTNDAIVKTTGVLMFSSPTVTDIGIFKTTTTMVGTRQSAGSREQSVPEYILAPDGVNARDYIIRATNNSGGTVDIVNALFFFDSEAT